MDPVSLAQHFIDPNGLLHSNLNQGEFLLGITFQWGRRSPCVVCQRGPYGSNGNTAVVV